MIIKYIKLIVLSICLGLFSTVLFAQSKVMPPPKESPQSLPPLPNNILKNLSHKQTLPTVVIPKNKDNKRQNHNTYHPPIHYSAEKFLSMLHMETKRLGLSLASHMKIDFVDTGSRSYQTLINMHMIEISPKVLSRYDSGMTSVLSVDNKLSYQGLPVCYILFDPSQSKDLWNKFVVPLAGVSDEKSGPAWLIAHQVGHCIDNLNLRETLSKHFVWSAHNTNSIGLLPLAVKRAYGNKFSKDTFLSKPMKLYNQVSQQQYSERLADAFASIWMLKLNNSPNSVNIVKHIRSSVLKDRPHYTVPVFDKVIANENYINSQDSVINLWNLAKKIQLSSGVSEGAINHYSVPTPDNHVFGKNIDPNKVDKWIVTPNGPKAIDKKGNIIKKGKEVNPSHNFGSNSFNNTNQF